MIYKNKERVDSICAEIDKCMGDLIELNDAKRIKIDNNTGYNLFTIVVDPDSTDEYAHAGIVMINFIKDDLRRKIADLHTDLKKL